MFPKSQSQHPTPLQFKNATGYIPPPPPGKARPQQIQQVSVSSVASNLLPNAYGFTLGQQPYIGPKRTMPHPPPLAHPQQKSHPLAVGGASKLPLTKFVDKSNGLLASIMDASDMPVGLQDWVNRLYTSIEAFPGSLRGKADAFVRATVIDMLRRNQMWKQHWVLHPVPTVRELTHGQMPGYIPPPPPPAKRHAEVIDLDLVSDGTKKVHMQEKKAGRKGSVPEFTEDYIPLASYASKSPHAVKKHSPKHSNTNFTAVHNEELSRRNNRAEKYKQHLSKAPDSEIFSEYVGGTSVAPSEMTSVKYEFGNDEDDVFGKTEKFSVVGLCQTMEKRYLRLTSAPDPNLVRPENVLRNWLTELTTLWTAKAKEWKYIEDQLRAIRQDLTVQNLRGEFTTTVYELNARWALESGDIGQFNQCQTQLRRLHEDVHVGDPNTSKERIDSICEFVAYRLLYYYFQDLRVDEQLFLSQILADPKKAMHRYVKFAIEIRNAAVNRNFKKYFALCTIANEKDSTTHAVAKLQGSCSSPPEHMKYLLSAFEPRQRVVALISLTKAFVTQISVSWLASLLGFPSDSKCAEFLESQGAVFKESVSGGSTMLDPKASYAKFSHNQLITGTKLKNMG